MDLRTFWWPVATADELSADKPLGRVLHGVPIVVFRNHDLKAAILIDRCPHRHAPLSMGKVCRGEIQCPYHGWKFNSEGLVTSTPGLETISGRRPLIPTIASQEEGGLIWACLAPNELTRKPILATEVGCETDSFFLVDIVQSPVDAVAENFLDGFHTHFVHSGWIRKEGKRQSVTAEVRQLPDRVEVRYFGETLQSGFISRVLEGDRTESFGRFRMPGIAELEYRGQKGVNLLVTAWLTPELPGQTRIHARIATRRGLSPGWLKRSILARLFDVIVQQDKEILEQTHDNIRRFERESGEGQCPAYLNSELDLSGPSIRRLLNGESLEESCQSFNVQL